MERTLKGACCTMEKFENRGENTVGSSRIRGKWLYKYWDELEEYHVGEKYDFMIFQKAYWPQMILGEDNVKYDGIKIFDVCDPDFLERDYAFRYYRSCHAVVTSTEPLAEYIKLLLPKEVKVRCIPDRIDFEEHKNIKKIHNEKLKTVGWFGYSHNYKYLEPAVPALEKRGIDLVIYSDSAIQTNNKTVRWKKYDYKTIHDELIRYDAIVMPNGREEVDFKGRFKSDNKKLTCYALGIPVIETEKDLERLQDRKVRESESKENLSFVRKEYDIKKSVAEYKKLLEDIIEE